MSGGSGAASATAGATTATAVVSILAGPAGLAEGASGVVQVGVDRPMDVDAVVAIQADAGLAVEPESLVFGPGRAATRQVTVTAVDDAIDAGDRTLGIRLVPGDDLTSGDPVAWPIAVADNDLPAVSVQVAARVVESATVVPVVVRIDRISLRPVVVTLTLGGTADDADVSVSATQAVIAPGMTETVLWLTVAADDAVEPSETVAVLAEVVSGAQPQGASGLLRILTDDLPAPVVAYQERTASADGTLTVRWYVALPADSDVGTLQITGLPAGSTAVEMLDGVAVVRIQGRSTDLAGQMASVSFSASGGTGPSASVTVQGGSGSDGDRNQVPLPPPTIGALTITAGLTGDRHGAFPGVGDPEAYFTNKTQVSFSVPVSVSFGTLGPVEVRLDGPSPQVVQGDSGTVQVPAEGLYTLTVTATAVDGERRAVGSGTPVVLVVDRTGPVVAVSATAPLRTALEGDRDLLFVNGMDPGINDENRSWGLNCLAPSEVVRFLGFSASDGLSGISRTAGGQVDTDRIRAQARDNYWRAQDPGKVHDVPVDVPDPAAADPVQIRVTEVVLPASADDDGWKLTAIPHSRYKIALKVQDRCGNYARSKQADPRLAASDETGGNDADAAPGQGYRDQFKVWVDTRPPEVDVARLPYQQWDPEVVPWNEQKTHRIFDLTRLRMARAGWDAAYVWRDAPSESTLARRVQRGPTDLPDLAAWTVQADSWWVLATPVPVPPVEYQEVTVVLRAMDLAGNRSGGADRRFRRGPENSSSTLRIDHPMDVWYRKKEREGLTDEYRPVVPEEGRWAPEGQPPQDTIKVRWEPRGWRYGVGDWQMGGSRWLGVLGTQPLQTDQWVTPLTLTARLVAGAVIPVEPVTEPEDWPRDRGLTQDRLARTLVLDLAKRDDPVNSPWEGVRRVDITPPSLTEPGAVGDRMRADTIERWRRLDLGSPDDGTHWWPRIRAWKPESGLDPYGWPIRTARTVAVNPDTRHQDEAGETGSRTPRLAPGVITVPPSYFGRVPDLAKDLELTLTDHALEDLTPSTVTLTLATHPTSYFEGYADRPTWTAKTPVWDFSKRDYLRADSESLSWPTPGGAQHLTAQVTGTTAKATLSATRARGLAAGHARVFMETGTGLYDLVAGWHFANVIRLSPDIVAAGSRVTVRIEAGFLDKAHPFSSIDKDGDWVRFKVGSDDITIPKTGVSGASAETLQKKIAILDQRLIADGVNATIAQTMELDLLIGADVPADLADVEVQCGAVEKDGGGRHVMVKGMAICRVRVNPIDVWQLETVDRSIRIQESKAPTDPSTCWLDVYLPHYSTAEEVRSLVAGWSLTWAPGPVSYLLKSEGNALTTLTTNGRVPVTESKIRVLGSAIPSEPFEDEAVVHAYHMIETGDTGIAGLPSIVVGYVAVKARATELTLGLGDFYKAPWGAMTLFGNKGTVSFIDEGPKPDLWPTQVQPGAPTGAYGRTERFVIRSDAALKADDGKECAELITYTDGSWTVSGRMPGATIIQVVPIIDGQVAASPALEIPIPVDLPVLSDPGPFQVQVARENNRARMQYVGGQSTTLTEQPTPIPLDGGAVDQRWRWPDGWGTVPGNVLTQHTTTRELDAVAEIGFFHLAQYLPVREGGIPWHYPVSNPDDSIFKLPPETTGSGASRDLGYLTLAKIWALDPSAGDAWVQRRLRESGPPQELWRRWWKRFSNAGFVSRTSIEEMQQRRLVEVRARQAMDQVTIARLKRWFSMAWDYRDPARVVTPPAAAWVGDGVANQGIAMLGRTSGSSQPIMVEVSRSLWEWVTDGLGFSDPLSRLLDTALTPGWSIGHPFTEEVVRHMMDERLSAAAAVVERLRQAGKPPGHEDFPVRLATDTDVLGDGTGDTAMSRQPLMVHLVTRPDGVTTEVVIALPSTAVTMYGGSNGIGARQAYQRNGFIYPYLLVGPQNTMDLRITGEAVFDDGDEPHLYVGRWDEAAGKAVEVDYVRVRASDDDGALIVRALQEVSLLRRMLDDRVAYAATQDLRNDAPISFFLYTVGDFISPVGDIYKAAWGADVLTGETLSNGDRALAGAFAALEIIPGVVSLTGKVAGRAGKGLRAGSRTIGQDVAKTAARNTADTADQRVKDAVAQMTEEGQERGVAAGARRPQGFQRLADNAFIDGVQRAARFMDMDATDVLKRHVGLGRVGRMMLAKKGSMAPLVTAAHSTANAAQRALPPSWLVRGTDGRTAKATMETVDDLHVLEEVIASYRAAHGDKACAEFMEEIQQAACFPAGTLVETADRGWQPIERVRIDDHVVTRSDEGPDRPLMAGRVSRVMVSHTPVLVQARLAASGATRLLRATPEHPVYAEGRGWIPLAAAEPGDRLLGGSEPVVVQEIQVEDLPAPIAVYNLAIDDAHTYRVGVLADDGGLPTAIWVHNKCVWLSVAEERVRLLYRADPTKRTPAEWMEIVRDSHLEMMANVKLLSRRGKVAWRIAPSPSRVDKASANTKLRMINGPGNSKNLRKRMQKVMGLDAIPPGMEAHHLVPKEIAANHRSFLAKIGFDIDNPRNGTFLPDSQLSGPRGPGQKQAAHIDNHPKYREAMDEVMGKVSDDFEDAVEGIGLMKNTSEYRDAYAKIVSDFQEKVSRIQIAARDNLQKGAPLSGNDQAVKDYWTNKLGKVIK